MHHWNKRIKWPIRTTDWPWSRFKREQQQIPDSTLYTHLNDFLLINKMQIFTISDILLKEYYSSVESLSNNLEERLEVRNIHIQSVWKFQGMT